MRSVAEQSKAHLHDVWLDDFAQKAHIMRTATALGYGLNPEQYSRPFPGTQTSSSVEVKQTSSGVGKVVGAALLGLAGAGVIGTGLAGTALAAWLALQAARGPATVSDRADSEAEARARVRIFWGDSELTPEAPALEAGADDAGE